MDVTTFITSTLAFVAAIGILVTIHEFGHYWVARLCGVKVLRFSVGFGKPLWLKKAGEDQIEYVLAAIPLGGYVKMLDEREGDVDESEKHRAFNRQPVSKRFAIVVAGPAFNFIFAILAYSLMYMNGVSGLKPFIGNIQPESVAAQADLREKDLILSINGVKTPSWEKARFQMLQQSVDKSLLTLEVQGTDYQTREVTLDIRDKAVLEDEGTDVIDMLGFSMWRPQLAPQIDEVLAGGAAEAAGLKAGDLIQSLNGHPIKNVHQWVDTIRAHPLETMELVVLRDGVKQRLSITPNSKQDKEKTIGYIGVKNVVLIPENIRREMRSLEKFGLFEAVSESVQKTWQMSALTLKVLGKLVIGEASLKNLSGPITIAKYAGLSASIGAEQFFSFLAIISISLGVLNLLPVPMLDGGHLMYYLIEIIKGSPVSEAVEAFGQRIGMAVLLILMTVAIYNDLLRLVN
jgi:regulator of sigma E protease